jgi:hypothetical protein
MALIGLVLVIVAGILVVVHIALGSRGNAWAGSGYLLPVALLLVIAALAFFGVQPLVKG